jgi:HPt (histidine-containing phosphotransfer) domain-containing protein
MRSQAVDKEHILEHDTPASEPDRGALDGASNALDVAYLSSQTFGDTELEAELLTLFIAQARRLVPKLATDDIRERAHIAHLLKGSARAIGAQLLAAAVDAFEQGNEQRQEPGRPAYQAVTTAFQQTEALIAARLSELQA